MSGLVLVAVRCQRGAGQVLMARCRRRKVGSGSGGRAMPACDSNAEQYDASAWFEIVLVAVRCQRRAGQVRADVVRGQSMPEQEGQVGCGQRAVNAGTGRSGRMWSEGSQCRNRKVGSDSGGSTLPARVPARAVFL
jgi:hypothetical protein